ncbi:37057_t:CDS:2 [Gigaspora margarita]|uniref:37057_t:CDS:1 n=1 Tax=Gigaspora margarita TaxID=4874 RepID=A0ABN7UIY5_GIGMA|nr:37057_t:CDS:2 [Gigaspora margarita]
MKFHKYYLELLKKLNNFLTEEQANSIYPNIKILLNNQFSSNTSSTILVSTRSKELLLHRPYRDNLEVIISK